MVAACQGPGLPTQPGIPGIPCQSSSGVSRKGIGPCRVSCLRVFPQADAGIWSPMPSFPSCHGTHSIPRESQALHPCSDLSPSPSVLSSHSLAARTAREGGCHWPLKELGALRRWAASPWDLNPCLGSAECEGSCEGHKAAKPLGHSHAGGQLPGLGSLASVQLVKYSVDRRSQGWPQARAGEQLASSWMPLESSL